MADYARLAASFLGVGSLLCQLILLVMQLRTYRRTGHSSLLILAIATALAVLYLGSGFAAAAYASTPSVLSRLYLGMEVLFVVQAVLSIWGAASLFRAFATRYAQGDPEIDRSAAPSELIRSAEQKLSAGAPEAVVQPGSASTLAGLSRLWALRRVDNVSALATERSVALLSALSLALWTGIDRLRSGPNSTFNVFGIPSLGLVLLMLLVLAFAMGRGSRPPLPYRQSLFIVAAVLPVLIVLNVLIDHYLPGRWAHAAIIVLIIYALIYAWRALRAFSGARQPWAVFLSVALLCGYIWLDGAVYIYPSLWMHSDPDIARGFDLSGSR